MLLLLLLLLVLLPQRHCLCINNYWQLLKKTSWRCWRWRRCSCIYSCKLHLKTTKKKTSPKKMQKLIIIIIIDCLFVCLHMQRALCATKIQQQLQQMLLFYSQYLYCIAIQLLLYFAYFVAVIAVVVVSTCRYFYHISTHLSETKTKDLRTKLDSF